MFVAPCQSTGRRVIGAGHVTLSGLLPYCQPTRVRFLPRSSASTTTLSNALGFDLVAQRGYSNSARTGSTHAQSALLPFSRTRSPSSSPEKPALANLDRKNLHLSRVSRAVPPTEDVSRRNSQGDKSNGPLPTKQVDQRSSDTDAGTAGLAQKVKESLPSLTPHENIYNIPNFLTVTRLIASPVLGYLIIRGDLKWALGLFAYAGITDLIDGWMARRFKLQTVVGSVIDPMADKLLMTVMTVALAAKGLMPAYLATLILGRDVTLATAAIYYRFASLPAPKTFARYWDFSLPSAQVHPTTVSKYNTFLQLLLIGASLAVPVIAAESWYTQLLQDAGSSPATVDRSITYFQYLVAATTAWSGLSYAFLKDAVTILGKDEVLKQKQGRRGRAIIGVGFGAIVLVSAWLALFRDHIFSAKSEATGEEERFPDLTHSK